MVVRSPPLGPMACRPMGSPLLPLRTGMAVAGPKVSRRAGPASPEGWTSQAGRAAWEAGAGGDAVVTERTVEQGQEGRLVVGPDVDGEACRLDCDLGAGPPQHGEYVLDGCGDVAVERTRRILGPDGDPRGGELGRARRCACVAEAAVVVGRPGRRLPDRDEVAGVADLRATAGHVGVRPPSRSGRRADLATAEPGPLGQIFVFSRTHAPICAMAASTSGIRPAP